MNRLKYDVLLIVPRSSRVHYIGSSFYVNVGFLGVEERMRVVYAVSHSARFAWSSAMAYPKLSLGISIRELY